MWKTVLIYGVILAVAALALQWLQYRYLAQAYPVEIYVGLIALGFMALGIWVGAKLFRKPSVSGPDFEGNPKAVASLGISGRELEVLELLAAGQSNKEIAGKLSLSPNTVKTHISRLFEKLEVSRRTQAIHRARELGMIR
jgi:DNA-binding CsgD family transcriptional regulator